MKDNDYIKPLGYDPDKCRALMEQKSLSGMVLTSGENVFYTTGLAVTRGHRKPDSYRATGENQFPSFSVLHPDGSPIMITWMGALGGA